jgi:gentisate 1,2-dioxygenase
MPTIAAWLQLLPPGFATRPCRSSDGTVVAVVEGSGTVETFARPGQEGAKFDISARDIFVVPGWTAHTIRAHGDLVLFAYSDRAAQEKLGFFREQRL